MLRWARNLAIGLLLCGAAGCATTGSADPRDPLEGLNRATYAFNDGFDKLLIKPVATVYRDALPDPIRVWVRNFFANLYDPWIGINNLLQGKVSDAVTDWARFGFNSTLGVFGINDVATSMGLEKHDEDLGQTFGRWGMGDGAYLVIPFWGSSSVRDGAGLVGDLSADLLWKFRPIAARNSAVALRYVSRRADLLDASRILEEAALDKYVFQRDAYLQRRRSLVYDGNPPRAERDSPRADADVEPVSAVQDVPAPPSTPAATVTPAAAQEQLPPRAAPEAVEAAVRLLESPASPAAAGG
jgi:phospholipid-binding lipoprotein MlaA